MDDNHFMKQALKEAQRAAEAGEVPIGAVIVMQNKIIGRGFNQVETLNDSTAHAETISLTSAFNYLGTKYLPEAAIYVTIEPCVMCCGALYWSKIGKLVYGAPDPKHGGLSKVSLHPKTEIIGNIYADECVNMMQSFFRKKR